ncbi:hypothetical protein GQ53DRAFT_787680 [Thozetella sp. PMI_491]|nr:hypothetical protein GQ53DRAFT_787680 [Thozetella sp. PMI_491]
MSPSMYNNPTGVLATSVLLEILAALCVGLRFYSRRRKGQAIMTSDWLILAALIFGTGLAVMEVYGVVEHALGYPAGGTFADPQHPILAGQDKIDLAALLLGIAGAGCDKLSFCFFYWHLFSKVTFRRFLIFWIITNALWTIAFILSGLLECKTHLTAVFGTAEEYYAYCASSQQAGFAMIASDILTDLVTLIIPIPIVIGLKMDRRTKILTLLVFIMGSLSVGSSIAKAYSYIIGATGNYTEDPMLTNTGFTIWNMVEVQLGIVAACGPTLRLVLGHLIPAERVKAIMLRLGLSQLVGTVTRSLPSFVKHPETTEKASLKSWAAYIEEMKNR